MTEEQRQAIEFVANKLLYSVEPQKVEGERITLFLEGGQEWSKTMTTYTLGLILKGIVA